MSKHSDEDKAYPPGAQYFPPSRLFPYFLERGEYRGFDPMDYCQALKEKVDRGELSYELAQAMWRKYADGVEQTWVDMPRPGPCSFGGSGGQRYAFRSPISGGFETIGHPIREDIDDRASPTAIKFG